ncbi:MULTISPECIES: hypothetical protein [unclassified Cupriavidus]|uniref:hypothetical protein n=1 Tax=unclassified Cupriavidus TaxID=2640874 RepID=UPI00295E50A9|nr:hypothetical protein [Cupriavidus sp. TA19]
MQHPPFRAQEEHRWQVEFIRPKVVFIENALLDRYFDMLRGQGVTVVCMDPPAAPREGLLYFWDLLDGVSEENPGVESEIRNVVLSDRFTGGTTGKGKCAAYTWTTGLPCATPCTWKASRSMTPIHTSCTWHRSATAPAGACCPRSAAVVR